jgi:hypothetical protein
MKVIIDIMFILWMIGADLTIEIMNQVSSYLKGRVTTLYLFGAKHITGVFSSLQNQSLKKQADKWQFHSTEKMKLPSELPIISLDAFLATSIPLLVAFSINDVIPNLSAPFLTPSKNVFHPRPSIARKTIMITIHTRNPITQLHC